MKPYLLQGKRDRLITEIIELRADVAVLRAHGPVEELDYATAVMLLHTHSTNQLSKIRDRLLRVREVLREERGHLS